MEMKLKWRYKYLDNKAEDFERKIDAIVELMEKFNLDRKYATLFVERYIAEIRA